jgi:phage terminase large subunit
MTFIANDTMQEGYKAKFNDLYNNEIMDGYDEVCHYFPAYQKQQIRLRTKKKGNKDV